MTSARPEVLTHAQRAAALIGESIVRLRQSSMAQEDLARQLQLLLEQMQENTAR